MKVGPVAPGSATGEVTRVFVTPQARHRGIGQHLLDVVERAARQQRVTRLRLDTSDYLSEAAASTARTAYPAPADSTEPGQMSPASVMGPF
jgi:GNAT superfamily N-acetyltransferase